jgi:tRNA dimethylallyltransferase
MKTESKLIVILGATASGKTSVAARLASETGSEIISADSRQVYKGLNIGSGKDLGEYVIDGKPVPYHLIDIINPLEEFSVYHYQKRFFEIFEKITANGIVPIMVGGTGLYIDSVLGRYDMAEAPEDRGLRSQLAKLDDEELAARLEKLNPELHNTTDLKDRSRMIRAIEIVEKGETSSSKPLPEIRPLVIGLKWPREILRARILSRLKSRLNEGMIDEVEGLHAGGVTWERLDYFGLEYRFVAQYLQGKMNRNDMTQKLHSAICQFAKRQETWFRRMERRGTDIHWVEDADYEKVREIVASELPA